MAAPTQIVTQRHRTPVPPTALDSSAYDAILPQLAMELAADLEPVANILQKYRVTPADLQVIQSSPMFKHMLDDAVSKFKALGNTGDRIKIKAQLVTELGIEYMHELMQDDSLTPAARVGAFAAVKSLTGLDRPKEVEAGMKFELVITLPPAVEGGPAHTLKTIEGEVFETEVEGDGCDEEPGAGSEEFPPAREEFIVLGNVPPPNPREFFADVGVTI